jgi:hypothetical protein
VIRALLPLSLLAACAAAPPAARLGPVSGPSSRPALGLAEVAPDEEGRCWATDTQPAVIETQTVQEQATPAVLAEDGTVRVPATYRSTVRQEIARERAVVAFETLCPPAYTPDFVASLQRALMARGYYQGAVDGALGPALGRAIQDFQRGEGPDSPLLSLAAARELGLVPLSREEVARL